MVRREERGTSLSSQRVEELWQQVLASFSLVDLAALAAEGRRNRFVVASKYSLTMCPGDPNASGNQRKNMVQSVEDSLQRLGTDHLDLLYLHVWDQRTPVEEILRAVYAAAAAQFVWREMKQDAADAFGDLAGNPADLLVRLPGVEGEAVDGDIRYVRIRIGDEVLPFDDA